jgi:3-oxoacyl-[acyl-carrier protein] reductase
MSEGKGVALVTGASRGIGRGVARSLAGAGFDVVINYAGNRAAAEECAGLCQQARPGRYPVCQGDIASAADRARLVDFVRQTFGRIDCLVNNAGVAPAVRADLLEAGEESFDRLISTNLKGPYFLTQAVAKWMVELRGQLGEAGYAPTIVTVNSISAYTASINRGDYCLSKAGLGMLTKLFAVRLADHGIGVFEVRPGVIKTDMTAPVGDKYDKLIAEGLTPIRRWGFPDDVGRAVAALAAGHFPFSTGEVINVDGGFHLRWL